jgi:hypothetical protein
LDPGVFNSFVQATKKTYLATKKRKHVLLINYSNNPVKTLTTMAAPYKITFIPTTTLGAMFGFTVELAVALWLVLD